MIVLTPARTPLTESGPLAFQLLSSISFPSTERAELHIPVSKAGGLQCGLGSVLHLRFKCYRKVAVALLTRESL